MKKRVAAGAFLLGLILISCCVPVHAGTQEESWNDGWQYVPEKDWVPEADDPVLRLTEKLDPQDFARPTLLMKHNAKYKEAYPAIQELTKGCDTEPEKIKAIHDWMCRAYAYDHPGYRNNDFDLKNQYLTQIGNDEKPFLERTFIGVCENFAFDFAFYLRCVGIPCIQITNTDSRGNGIGGEAHAWNIVFYEGQWRSIDVTWDCMNKFYGLPGTSEGEKNVFGKPPKYLYYNLSGKDMDRTAGNSHWPARLEISDERKEITYPEFPDIRKEADFHTDVESGYHISLTDNHACLAVHAIGDGFIFDSEWGYRVYTKEYQGKTGYRSVKYKKYADWKPQEKDTLYVEPRKKGSYVKLALKPYCKYEDRSSDDPSEWKKVTAYGDLVTIPAVKTTDYHYAVPKEAATVTAIAGNEKTVTIKLNDASADGDMLTGIQVGATTWDKEKQKNVRKVIYTAKASPTAKAGEYKVRIPVSALEEGNLPDYRYNVFYLRAYHQGDKRSYSEWYYEFYYDPFEEKWQYRLPGWDQK